jgi:hypothetical protein
LPHRLGKVGRNLLGHSSAVEDAGEWHLPRTAGLAHPFGSELCNWPPVTEDEAQICWVKHASDRNTGKRWPCSQISDAEVEAIRNQDSGDPARDGVR